MSRENYTNLIKFQERKYTYVFNLTGKSFEILEKTKLKTRLWNQAKDQRHIGGHDTP